MKPETTRRPRNRHGCLTAWLAFMIICNSATAILTPMSADGMKQAGLEPSPISILTIVFCSLANVGFAVALLRWKKWGFYGFIATSIVAMATNLSVGIGILPSLFGLLGVVILYGILNMGGSEKAWPHLR